MRSPRSAFSDGKAIRTLHWSNKQPHRKFRWVNNPAWRTRPCGRNAGDRNGCTYGCRLVTSQTWLLSYCHNQSNASPIATTAVVSPGDFYKSLCAPQRHSAQRNRVETTHEICSVGLLRRLRPQSEVGQTGGLWVLQHRRWANPSGQITL